MVQKRIKMNQLNNKWSVSGTRSQRHVSSNKRMTGVVYDERMLEHKHEWFPAEQESPARMKRPYERCLQDGLIDRCTLVSARHITEADLGLIHSKEYIQLIKKSRNFTRPELYELSGQYDGVFINESTWNCASLAAGSLQHIARLVASGQLDNALAFLRPPGHHAMHSEACGYCIFNNVAVAAASLLGSPPKGLQDPAAPSASTSSPVLDGSSSGSSVPVKKQKGPGAGTPVVLERILIIDWDVHHGQGTQYAFYNDKRVLFISIHRHEKSNFWPNLREADFDFIGSAEARGYNINIPLNDTGMCDSDYLAIFHNLIMPITLEFNPQLVIVSCGFDAAIGCPEGRMWLSPAVFGHFVHHMKMLAGGKLVVSMEGGYYVDSLTEGVVHVLKALLGDPVTPIRLTRPPCKSIRRTIDSCITALRGYWKSLHIQGISRSINRPSISHLSPFTWPMVRRVVWPDTNPLMPTALMEHIDRLLRDHLPGPVPRASQQTLLLLLPVLSLADLTKDENGQVGKKRAQQPQQTGAWSMSFIIQLAKLMQVNFYRSPEQTTGNEQLNYGKMDKPGPLVQKRKHIAANPSPTDQTGRSNKRKKRSNSNSSVEGEPGVSTGNNNSPGRWHPKKAMELTQVDFRGALQQAVVDLFTVKFSRLLILTERLSLAHLVDAIAATPTDLLTAHRKHMLRPRAEPSSRTCCQSARVGVDPALGFVDLVATGSAPKKPDGIESPRVYTHQKDEDQKKLMKQIGQLKEMFGLTSETVDSNTTVLPTTTAAQTMPQYLTLMHQPNVARLFVVDLTGSQQPWETVDTALEHMPSRGAVHCDVTWCSVVCASASQCKNGQVAATTLRALPLRAPASAGRHSFRGGHWLHVPLLAAGQSSGVPAVGDLVSAAVRLLLPVGYEYAPDLVFVQLHSHWMDEGNSVGPGVAHVIHLLTGLGAPLLVNCCHQFAPSGYPPLPSQMLLDVLLGRPRVPLLGSLCPTATTQHMLRNAMRANCHRWKCLNFAGNLVEWR